MGNLQHRATAQRDIPFATQRSDNWEPMSMKNGIEIPKNERTKKFQQIDLDRRIKDAQLLLDTNK